jgi:signal transduction histidine kinase
MAEAEWQAGAQDAEHLRLRRLLTPTSHLMVPLMAHGRTLGVLSLVMAGSGRRYEPTALPLAEEVARRAALAIDNAQLYRQVQEAVRLREEFLSIASHELKTPLTTIKGYIQILDRQLRHPGTDPDRLLQVTGPLQRQIDRLEALVTDLLDISRMQQGRLALRREPVDLGELARLVLARLEEFPHRQPEHSLVVEAPVPVTGWWDGGRLDQVLTNLVANALKYSPGGGEVRVTVRQAGDEALVAVSDQGQGMTPEEQTRLFQPFSRGQAINQAIPGVGLGLYIAAQVVSQHGGRIAVQSTVGGGSTFTVHLPLNRAGPSAPPLMDA